MPGLQKIPKETILGAIAKIGPVQPIDVRKEIKQGDTFLIGAMLSEFVAGGQLVISKTRRGGSPFYYDPNKPESLELISQYLNEKDRRTCALLREQKILREDAVEPLVRVGLQNIPDFSRRMTVDEGGAEVVYWRYYLVSEADARKIIAGSQRETPAKAEPAVETKPETKPAPAEVAAPAPAQPEAKPEPRPKKAEKEIKLPSPAMHPAQDGAVADAAEAKPKKRAPRAKKEPATAPSSQPSLQDWLIHDTLYEKVQIYAVGVKGILTHQQSIRPNSELTCVLSNEGAYGRLSVFVLALNKKKVVEKDITTALLSARGQGMPLLVLSVEEIPAKIAKSFETTLNVYFKRL